MGDNFARKDDGQRQRVNDHNYESIQKYGVTPRATVDLRFMSETAKEEQRALEQEIIERMSMTQA